MIGTAIALAVYLALFVVLFVLMAQSTRDRESWEEQLAEEERLQAARRDWYRRDC